MYGTKLKQIHIFKLVVFRKAEKGHASSLLTSCETPVQVKIEIQFSLWNVDTHKLKNSLDTEAVLWTAGVQDSVKIQIQMQIQNANTKCKYKYQNT